MSTTETEVPTEVPLRGPVADAEKTPQESLFKWSAWMHVGEGAQECEHRQDGLCDDPGHAHYWVRLPNPFQVRDITEKALAAQARYKRALRDPSSDVAAIMEEELEGVRQLSRETLVEEAVDKSFPDDYATAARIVDDMDDPNAEPYEEDDDARLPKKYASIDQDREEWQRQMLLVPEERSADFAVMESNIAAYGEEIEREMRALQEPRRAAFMAAPLEELVEIARRERVEHKATEIYLHHFNAWQWLVCTFKARKDKMPPNERVWRDINHMRQDAPPEVINALRATFDGLESNLAASRRGKGS